MSGALKRDEWETVRLGDVCDIYTGTGFPVQYQGEKTGVFPFYKVGDISRNVSGGNVFLGNCDNFISEDVAKILKGTIIPKDTVVFAKIGEAVKLNRRAVTVQDCLVDNNAMGVCPNQARVFLSYFYHYMCHLRLETYAESTTVPSVKKSVIEKIKIPLPPLDVQRRIADTLDKVTELITLRKTQLEKLDELVKARFVELFGDVANSPKYSGVPLGTICSTLSGGTPTTKVPEYYQGDIPWISTPYLGNNHINGSSAKAYITEDAIKNSATHLIPANTIMFGIRVGVGKSSIIDEPMCANQDIVALMGIDTNKYNLLFVKHTLDSYQSHFDSIKKGATILGITTDDLKKVLIPNVDIGLQNEFATFVEQTDKSKVIIQQSLDTLETLKKSLMQEYFG